MSVAGGGLKGAVQSYARMPPTPQASMQDLADLIEPGEFSGVEALIIGGSRGLGEVTAKLLAAGGARVTISYRVGGAEAEAVAQEIRASGGQCETLAYDASLSAGPQLAGLAAAPTHAYYFATPKIFGAQSALFARARLDAFLSVYVEGFLNLAEALRARRERRLPVLSLVGGRGGAAARHARIRHGQSGWRNALRRDQSGAGVPFTSRSIACRVCSPTRPPRSSERARRLRSITCSRSVRETQSWPRQAERARAPAGPLQTGLVG